MHFLAVVNNKGGVGKTTSAVNLAAAFAEMGLASLLVDLDPAASASVHLGLDKRRGNHRTLCDYLLAGQAELADFIQPTESPNLWCLPSEPALSEFYEEMLQEDTEFFLRREDFPNKFKMVIMDSPPNMGNLAYNALAIARHVLIPVQTQYLAMTGLELTLKTVKKVQRHLNPDLEILGFFATHFDRRTNVAKEVLRQLQETFGSAVFDTVIGVNSKLIEAYGAQKPVLQYASSARGAREYRALAREILTRLGENGQVKK